MATVDRLSVYQAMLDTGLVPLFYQPDPIVSENVIRACSEGGARLLEFTNRGDFAIDVFRHVTQQVNHRQIPVILGAGSVMDAPTAALYLAYGANFIVSPSFNEEVARLCNRRKVAYLPGCATATEIARAEEWGAEIVKVFPGETVGGPAFVKAVLAPTPWTRIMPTGGVDASPESIRSWLHAGAACLGMGSKLISKELLARRDFTSLSGTVHQVLAWIRELR